MLISSINLKNSFAIFHAVIDYEIQIKAAVRGLSQRVRAVTLEKWVYHFSSYLIIVCPFIVKKPPAVVK